MGWNFYNSSNNAWWGGTDQLGGVWPYPVTLGDVLRQSMAPVHRDPAHVALVLRLGRHRLPDGDARHLRDGVRPDPPGVGGPREQARRAVLRDPDHAVAVARDLVLLRVQLDVHELDARRNARDRDHVRRLDGRGGGPPLPQAGDLQRVADREVQGRRHPADHGGGGAVPRVPRLLHLQVAAGRRVRIEQPRARSSTWAACTAWRIGIYVVSRIVRKRQGMDLGMVYNEIPAE